MRYSRQTLPKKLYQIDTILPTVHYSTGRTVRYIKVQYNRAQYNTLKYNTVKYNTVKYNTVKYNEWTCCGCSKFKLLMGKIIIWHLLCTLLGSILFYTAALH